MRNDDGRLQTVDRALRLLVHLNENEGAHQLRHLAAALSMDKAVVHRMLRTMAAQGFVSQDDATGAYRLGPQAHALGRPDSASLFAVAREPMQTLMAATGFSIFLTLPLARESVCVDRVEAQRTVRVSYEIGRRLPYHAGSPGKALLSAFSPERRARALGVGLLQRYTAKTIVSRAALDRELARITECRYATSLGELEDGISGVAAVVRDARALPVAALSLSGLATTLPESRFAALGERLVAAADAIGQRLGAPDRNSRVAFSLVSEG